MGNITSSRLKREVILNTSLLIPCIFCKGSSYFQMEKQSFLVHLVTLKYVNIFLVIPNGKDLIRCDT